MASFKADMLANIAGSMRDRADIHGESPAEPPAARSSAERQGEGRKRLEGAAVIRIDRIAPDPHQPRSEFDRDALDRLASSIRERGQLQPIRVRWDEGQGTYVVVVGERRWRAAQLAGLETLACVVMTGEPTEEDLLEDQLVENCLREDLRPIEQARAFHALLTSRGLTQRQLAERLRIGQASIARALALLELPEDLQGRVDAGDVPASAAYEVARVKDEAVRQDLVDRIIAGEMTRDETAAAVRVATGKPARAGKGRGGARGRKPTSRVVRTPAGKVSIELRKGAGPDAILALAEEAVRLLRAELAGDAAAA